METPVEGWEDDDRERRRPSALSERATKVVLPPSDAADIARQARSRARVRRRRRIGLVFLAAFFLPMVVARLFGPIGGGGDLGSGTTDERLIAGPTFELEPVDGPEALSAGQVGSMTVRGQDGFVTVAIGPDEGGDRVGAGTSVSILVSPDGDTWERWAPAPELADVHPTQLLERDGDYLLVAARFTDDGSGTSEAVVAWSSELTTWEVVPVPLPPTPGVPEWVKESAGGTVAAWTEHGLVVAITSQRMIDVEALTPAEYRDRTDVVVHADANGLVVERVTGEPAADVPTAVAGAVPTSELDRIGWEELGIDPEDARTILEALPTSTILRSEDGRTFAPVDLGAPGDLAVLALAGTDEGHVLVTGDPVGDGGRLWRSDDGALWQQVPDPAGLLRNAGMFPGPLVLSVDDLLLGVGTGDDLPTAWVSDDGARTWRLLDLAARDRMNGPAVVELIGGGDGGVAVMLRSAEGAAPQARLLVSTDLRTWYSADVGALRSTDVMASTGVAAVGRGRVLLGIDGQSADTDVGASTTRWFGADLPTRG